MNGRVMGLLAAGVPLSLLADLVSPPDSGEVLVQESRHDLRA
ncbi:MAG: hypothetical protein ACJ735_01920 [Actinomycetes bacterium]